MQRQLVDRAMRGDHDAFADLVLRDGRVLIVGGYVHSEPPDPAELFELR